MNKMIYIDIQPPRWDSLSVFCKAEGGQNIHNERLATSNPYPTRGTHDSGGALSGEAAFVGEALFSLKFTKKLDSSIDRVATEDDTMSMGRVSNVRSINDDRTAGGQLDGSCRHARPTPEPSLLHP